MGMDEHGDKINRTAIQNGKTVQSFVDEISDSFRALNKGLGLSKYNFIRTTDKKKHWPGVYKLWKEIDKRGDLYKKGYEGLYCVGCEKFLTEKDLINGECPLHKKIPEKVIEENFFFRLSRYGKDLERLISTDEVRILPETKKNEVLSFIREGLEDISFSRLKKSVPWGIPVPDSDQTIYVWCDALTNYLTAVGYGRNDRLFKKWWPADIQYIGKDILRFHAVYWLAMLLSAGLPLPKAIWVHGFLTANGQKMSKTTGNIVNPFDAVKKYGTDAFRYYMLREIPSDGDGDFSWDKFKTRYNDDLAKGVGNFISRASNLIAGEKIYLRSPISKEVEEAVLRTKMMTEKHMNEFRLHEALASVFDLVKFGDGYINEKQPWKNMTSEVARDMAELARQIGIALSPFMPDTAEKISKIFPIKSGYITPKKTKPLFPRAE
jgi:methionyl-tRNA synthetase